MQNITPLQARLFAMQDTDYRAFQCRLLPTVDPDRVIGVRTPALRKLARAISGTPEAAAFMAELPHHYYEEDNLHAFLIERIGDVDACLAALDAFLPCVDNWATCDSMSPPVLKKHPDKLLSAVDRWMAAADIYTVRFGIGMLMRHFLDARFDPAYLARVAAVPTGEYYLHMMVAWYFATALTKQYAATVPYLREHRLSARTHNKAIQKACESYRIPADIKKYLRTLKIYVKKPTA